MSAMPTVMQLRALLLLVIAVAASVVVGCAPVDEEEEELEETTSSMSAPLALDGVYHAPEGGPHEWVVFKGDRYVTWKRSAACAGSAPPASCEGKGKFVLDAARGTLVMTDSRTGKASTQEIQIQKTRRQSGDPTARTVRTASLGGSERTREDVVSEYSLVAPSSSERQAAVTWRELFDVCRVVVALTVGESPGRAPVIQPPPPPIVQTAGCAPTRAG
ncbi:MAG: hypothetical protein KIT84_34485 [Labilithrix sp.]|nr:hypothetical protein [Labilithrix sp.]MCW5816156.1 hypothetical protein [Labilithrix sp.]